MRIMLPFLGIMIGACAVQKDVNDMNMKSGQANPIASKPDASFFENCAFISVDFQPGSKYHMTQESMPSDWRERGFSVEDINNALDFLYDVAIPNAYRVADGCRQMNMPMIFVHWGYQFKDAMDADPSVRKGFLRNRGEDYDKWPHRLGSPGARPNTGFKVRPGEYVIAKTAQDAFPSSNIHYVLQNLGIENIVFIGGHTGACLGKTSKSAKKYGYRTLCIRDATFDARESTHIPNMMECHYDYIMTTADFLKWVDTSYDQGIRYTKKKLQTIKPKFNTPVYDLSKPKPRPTAKVDESFFKNCVFVSVDHQPNVRHYFTAESIPTFYKEAGFSLEDLNAEVDHLFDVAKPNAVKVADACRQMKLPMIFVHWGYQFHDAMDLDPETRNHFLKHFGTEFDKWPHHITRPDSKPYEGFKVRSGEYVIAKTAQDAFTSSNIDYVLKNLGAKNIVFIGGHTGGCLGRTSLSAKKRGYKMLCVEDACFDARRASRIARIEAVGYDHIVTTAEFLKLVDEYSKKN